MTPRSPYLWAPTLGGTVLPPRPGSVQGAAGRARPTSGTPPLQNDLSAGWTPECSKALHGTQASEGVPHAPAAVGRGPILRARPLGAWARPNLLPVIAHKAHPCGALPRIDRKQIGGQGSKVDLRPVHPEQGPGRHPFFSITLPTILLPFHPRLLQDSTHPPICLCSRSFSAFQAAPPKSACNALHLHGHTQPSAPVWSLTCSSHHGRTFEARTKVDPLFKICGGLFDCFC